jgi:hypothetical protein
MISHKYFHLVSFFAIASFCISCSNKNAGIDERGFAVGEAPKQRLELKSTLGYQNYSNYVVTANVYNDNQPQRGVAGRQPRFGGRRVFALQIRAAGGIPITFQNTVYS